MVLSADEKDSFTTLLAILRGGGVAIAPGDTMYGLIGTAPETEARLRQLKGRSEEKPFLLLIAEAGWVRRFSDGELPDRIAALWPGPLTLVFPSRAGGTVALRVPDHSLLQRLLHALDRPLYSTSVNRAGEPPIATVAEMRERLEAEVDAVFDAGDLPPGPPSTLLDLSRRPFVVLRQGAVTIPDDVLA